MPKQDDFFNFFIFCCCSTMQGFGRRTAAPAMTAWSNKRGALNRLWLCLSFRGDLGQSMVPSQSWALLLTWHQARHSLAWPVELSPLLLHPLPQRSAAAFKPGCPSSEHATFGKKQTNKQNKCSVSLLITVAHWQDGEEMCVSTQTENFPKAEVQI